MIKVKCLLIFSTFTCWNQMICVAVVFTIHPKYQYKTLSVLNHKSKRICFLNHGWKKRRKLSFDICSTITYKCSNCRNLILAMRSLYLVGYCLTFVSFSKFWCKLRFFSLLAITKCDLVGVDSHLLKQSNPVCKC